MKKVLITGGGVSGLSAGIYSLMSGFDVTICEKNRIAGGNLTGWQRGDYHIDNCIHWLSGTNANTDMYKTWCELGALGSVDIIQPASLYTVEHNGETLSLCRDLHSLKNRMLEISPSDSDEILSFIKAVEAVQWVGGFGGTEHNGKYGVRGTASALPLLMKYYGLTAGALAARFNSPLIKKFFSYFFTDWFGALALLFVFADFCGGNGGIPAGGSLAMAERMVKRFTDFGGNILYGKEVKKINVSNGTAYSATLSDGTELFADHFILSGDPASAFGVLLPEDMPRQLSKLYENKRLKRFSSVQCAFSCECEELPFSGNLIIELPYKYRLRMKSESLIIRDYAHEPSFAPANRNILQTMVFCDDTESQKLIRLADDRELYSARKAHIASLTVSAVCEAVPALNGKIKCIDVWTPATYHRCTGAVTGSYMSFAFSSRVLPVMKKGAIPGLANVTLATQWQKAPGGLPIAASAGKAAAKALEASALRYEKKLFTFNKAVKAQR